MPPVRRARAGTHAARDPPREACRAAFVCSGTGAARRDGLDTDVVATLLLLLLGAQPTSAWIRLNGIFTDNMVLQTPHPELPPARIFGLAYTSEQVVVESSVGVPGGTVTVTPKKTGSSHWPRPLEAPWGNWSVDLNFGSTMPKEPFSITIRSKQNASDG